MRLIVISTIINLIQYTSSTNPEVTVEESPFNITRHLHPVRHHKGDGVNSPYMAATSSIQSKPGNKLESFALNCPHVIDSDHADVRVEVTWTLNETVLLKIENGNKKIARKLTSFSRKRLNGKTVLRVVANSGRYLFDYDEITGDFSMEISPMLLAEDVGSWQCHVTVIHTNSMHTLTSRRRIRWGTEPNKKTTNRLEGLEEREQTAFKRNSIAYHSEARSYSNLEDGPRFYSRNDNQMVFINRENEDGTNMVVFSRTDGAHDMPISRYDNLASDYSDSGYDYAPRSRHVRYPFNSSYFNAHLLTSFIFLVFRFL